MERYTIIQEVGDGTFGNVWRALTKHTSEVVAIKKMKKKYFSWEECINLREVKSLRKMNHPNIIKLKEVIRENFILYFVFEYMDCNMYQIMKSRRDGFSEAEVKNWCFQVFQGLAYMHKNGYFHRDLKPENLLVSKDHVKIADFGLAREINSQPPYTEYVATRWYRAPEILLQSPLYGPPVDMWAMGAIMAELFTLRPLFPGSSEADEIYKICNILGNPTRDQWPEGLDLANAINYRFPQAKRAHLPSLIPGVSNDAVSLIASLCSWDPRKRPTASEVLQHPFFQSCYNIPPSLRSKQVPARTPPPVDTILTMEQQSARKYLPGFHPKPMNHYSSAKPHAPLPSGVQRKLDLDDAKRDKSEKNYVEQQPKYQPPGVNGYRGGGGYVGNGYQSITEKMEKMTVGGGKPSVPMKFGGRWNEQPDLFGKQRQELFPGRPYMKKDKYNPPMVSM